jgi:hypothetical protein
VEIDGTTDVEWTTTETDSTGTYTVTDRTTFISGESYTISSSDPNFYTVSPSTTWITTIDGSTFDEWVSNSITYRTSTDS